jgi:branched-chain amino acid aminotransferase
MTKAKACGYYINSILAKREAVSLGYDEAIMLDVDGFISEASGENIFIVRKGQVFTPPLCSCVLGGITRDTIIAIAQDKGYTVKEESFARDILYTADEVFFTGTAAEVTPVREVDGRKIGDGEPGPVTLDLQKAFFETVRGQNKKYSHWLVPV